MSDPQPARLPGDATGLITSREVERQCWERRGFLRARQRHIPGIHLPGCVCKACRELEAEADREYPLTARRGAA